ncbi:hypothetical protein [Sphingomonas lutea]|uniref:hypothetical protein n=1 Tax=Sphingomonas lutea TaxID=1045317 RepID=UPI003CC833F0
MARAVARAQAGAADADLLALERQLGDMLGLKVAVTHKGQGAASCYIIRASISST